MINLTNRKEDEMEKLAITKVVADAEKCARIFSR